MRPLLPSPGMGKGRADPLQALDKGTPVPDAQAPVHIHNRHGVAVPRVAILAVQPDPVHGARPGKILPTLPEKHSLRPIGAKDLPNAVQVRGPIVRNMPKGTPARRGIPDKSRQAFYNQCLLDFRGVVIAKQCLGVSFQVFAVSG
jgi:hypothetical protein